MVMSRHGSLNVSGRMESRFLFVSCSLKQTNKKDASFLFFFQYPSAVVSSTVRLNNMVPREIGFPIGCWFVRPISVSWPGQSYPLEKMEICEWPTLRIKRGQAPGLDCVRRTDDTKVDEKGLPWS